MSDDHDRPQEPDRLERRATSLPARRTDEELRRTREALRESQERLRAALTAAGTGTFRWIIQTNELEWDSSLEELFGYEPGRAVHSLTEFIAAVHPDDRPGVKDCCERCARDGSDFDMEFRVVRPDGSVRWIAEKAKVSRHENGLPLSMTGACADITTRREAAETLRENEQRLRAIFNQAAVGIAVASLDGRFLDINHRFADILGYSADELRRLTFIEITHADDRPATTLAVRRLLAGTVPDYSLEKRYVKKDGSLVWSLSSVTLLKDPAGDPQRFIGVIEDITARRQAEEALRGETRTLELLNETGRTLAATLDRDAVARAVTDAATGLSGAEFGAFFYDTPDGHADVFLHHPVAGSPPEAFRKSERLRAAVLFGSSFRDARPFRSGNLEEEPHPPPEALQDGVPSGRTIRSCLAVPVGSRSGDVIGGLIVGHRQPNAFTQRLERLLVGVAAQAASAIDNARLYEASQRLSEERNALLESERTARAAAERMSDMKDEFLATLSHELRTPLNAILGWAQLLRRAPKDEADYLKGLETIERNARVQTQLIEDLLDMSRITSGRLRLDIQAVAPDACIEAAVETVMPAAAAKTIQLEKSLDRSTGPIPGDPARLQQVIWNLLSNAIKFTPRGGRVEIALKRSGAHVEISVADTGIGIKPEFIPYLFERFRQGDASTTRNFGGLGLGLSIVKSLVELHGGTVQVKSDGEGRGTTVTVQLPVTTTERHWGGSGHHRPDPSGAPGFAAPELAGLKVLVVDDHTDARELITRVLEGCGAEVAAAGTAADALSVVESQRPDVLITDIAMPDADGFELLKRVRAMGPERGGAVPAIAVTAFSRSEDRARALRAGFRVHVAKPVDPSELVATVASVAGRVLP